MLVVCTLILKIRFWEILVFKFLTDELFGLFNLILHCNQRVSLCIVFIARGHVINTFLCFIIVVVFRLFNLMLSTLQFVIVSFIIHLTSSRSTLIKRLYNRFQDFMFNLVLLAVCEVSVVFVLQSLFNHFMSRFFLLLLTLIQYHDIIVKRGGTSNGPTIWKAHIIVTVKPLMVQHFIRLVMVLINEFNRLLGAALEIVVTCVHWQTLHMLWLISIIGIVVVIVSDCNGRIASRPEVPVESLESTV